MNDTLRIIGLTFSARHGVRPEEKTLSQPFEVDVEINADFSTAAVSDRLEDTINYSSVVSIVEEVVQNEQFNLIEKLAGNIIERLAAIVHEGIVTVRVRKPRAPIACPFKTIEIEIQRDMNEIRQ